MRIIRSIFNSTAVNLNNLRISAGSIRKFIECFAEATHATPTSG